jgi:NAD(P)-dependent dehydrogenase (short-subunit alcohol dehydrogenase family)
MADRTIQIVFSNPFEGKDDEFNEWYDNVHVAEVLAMPGVISAQRYDLRPLAREDWVGPGFRYMAIYECEGDPNEVLASISKAVHAGEIALMAEVMTGGQLTTIPMEMWHRTLDVNLTGPFLCTRAVVPYMREKGYGKIINQSSGGAWLGSAHYGLTKLGIVSMTISLAKELAKDGIRVNAIAPGWTNTEAGLSTTTPEVRAAIARSIPFPFGEPEDLVGGLVYLASAASDWVTGHTLNIDGGWIPRT